jgi:DNA-binding response OmpR family regulator/class 3 adenylate cyclase/tetratricopeptide (TPR) repeat protein
MHRPILIVAAARPLRDGLATLLRHAGYDVTKYADAALAQRQGCRSFALGIVAPAGLDDEGCDLISTLVQLDVQVQLVAHGPSPRHNGREVIAATEPDRLLAAVAAKLAARATDPPRTLLQIGRYSLDLDGQALTGPQGEAVRLTSHEFRLLHTLAEKPGRVRSRNFLMQAMAGRDADPFDNAVQMAISRLRRKIEEDPGRPALIVTVPDAGYKFVPSTQPPAPDGAVPGVVPEKPPPAALFAERRHVTTLALDLVPAAGRSLPEDPEDLAALLQVAWRHARAVVEEHGGTVAHSLGGTMLAGFGLAASREDAAEQAVRAALALSAAPDGGGREGSHVFRAGLAVGRVVSDGGPGLDGPPVREALALCHAAPAGEVLAADSLRRVVRGLFVYRAHESGPSASTTAPGGTWRVLRAASGPSRFRSLRRTSTRMVGRAGELDMLRRRWQAACGGDGQGVLISGEAGIGKSRLAAGLFDLIDPGAAYRLTFQCFPAQSGTALHPVIGQLQHMARFRRGDDGPARLGRLRAVLREAEAAETEIALIASLLRLDRAEDTEAGPVSGSQARKTVLLDALTALLRNLAVRRPVAVLWEDAHWIDSVSLELLERALGGLRGLRLLLVVTSRISDMPPWRDRPHIAQIPLGRLNRSEAGEVLDDLTAGRAMTAPMREQILQRTDGVPLFVEEFAQAAMASPHLAQAEARHARGVPLDIPATLQDTLMARLADGGWPRQLAQIGSALGRDFPASLLQSVAGQPGARVEQGLQALCVSGLLLRQTAGDRTLFRFAHALLQDAVYETLLRRERPALHARIATALQATLPEMVATSPEMLAHHLTEAGETEAAIAWWRRAGYSSVQAFANVEAVAHFQRALALLAALPADAGRDALELALRVQLATPLSGLTGYTGPVFDANTKRALELCDTGAEPEGFFPALWGLVAGAFSTARVPEARALATRFLQAAERRGERHLCMIGHRLLGMALYGAGRLEDARTHLQTAIDMYDEAADAGLAAAYGFDQRVAALAYLGRTLQRQGLVAEAMRTATQAVSLAGASGHPNTRLYAEYALLELHLDCGDAAAAAQNERVAQLARVYGAQNMATAAHAVQAVLSLPGGGGGALAAIDADIATVRQMDWQYFVTRFSLFAAERAAAAGFAGQAQAWCAQAARLIDGQDQGGCRPELSFVTAIVMAAHGASANALEARLRDAVAQAGAQGAGWLQTRASEALAQVLRGEKIVSSV